MRWLEHVWNQLFDDFENRFAAPKIALAIQVLFDSFLIILLAGLLILLAKRSIARLETRIGTLHGAQYKRRIETATSLALSTIRYAIYILAILAILTTWGVNTTSLAFGTAALGAAVGFGSQGLVQDIITGLSILAEDQLAVGDFVEIAGKSGAVEEIGLRVVKIRDYLGAQHIIFNRNITMVSNYTTGAVPAFVDVMLESAETSDEAARIAALVCKDMAGELPYFSQPPSLDSVRRTSTNDVFLRINVPILPQQDGIIQSQFVARLTRAFKNAHIAISENGIRTVIASDLIKQALNLNI